MVAAQAARVPAHTETIAARTEMRTEFFWTRTALEGHPSGL